MLKNFKNQKKYIKKTFVIDEETDEMLDALGKELKEKFGSTVSQAFIIRKAIHESYKKIIKS